MAITHSFWFVGDARNQIAASSLWLPLPRINLIRFEIQLLTIPCGLVATIRYSHRRGPGSVPRKGVFLFFYFIFFMSSVIRRDNYYVLFVKFHCTQNWSHPRRNFQKLVTSLPD